jgi:hypothetical protein
VRVCAGVCGCVRVCAGVGARVHCNAVGDEKCSVWHTGPCVKEAVAGTAANKEVCRPLQVRGGVGTGRGGGGRKGATAVQRVCVRRQWWVRVREAAWGVGGGKWVHRGRMKPTAGWHLRGAHPHGCRATRGKDFMGWGGVGKGGGGTTAACRRCPPPPARPRWRNRFDARAVSRVRRCTDISRAAPQTPATSWAAGSGHDAAPRWHPRCPRTRTTRWPPPRCGLETRWPTGTGSWTRRRTQAAVLGRWAQRPAPVAARHRQWKRWRPGWSARPQAPRRHRCRPGAPAPH